MSILPMNSQPKKPVASTVWTPVPGKTGAGIPATQIQGPKNSGINPGGMYTGGPRKPVMPSGGTKNASSGFLASAIEPQGNRVSQATSADGTQAGSLVGSSVDGPNNGGIKYDTANNSGAIPAQKQGSGFIGEAQDSQPPTPTPTGNGVQSAPGSAADQYLNKDTDTVEGRLNNLLGQNSDYMKRAETKGLQVAASRGLLNSSMAAGAAQASAIDASLPIAQQDAATYSGFATRSQQYDQQQGLNADQFAQERAIKQWEQDNLAYAQLIKGISDINMQDMSKPQKDEAIRNLWDMYMKARPISSSLANVSIVDGKIVRDNAQPNDAGGTGGGSGGQPPHAGGQDGGAGGSGGAGGGAGGSGGAGGVGGQENTGYFQYKSLKEMPEWVRQSYTQRYGNVDPQDAQRIQQIISYANSKFKPYFMTQKERELNPQYSGRQFAGQQFRGPGYKEYMQFIRDEIRKVGVKVGDYEINVVAKGPEYADSLKPKQMSPGGAPNGD